MRDLLHRHRRRAVEYAMWALSLAALLIVVGTLLDRGLYQSRARSTLEPTRAADGLAGGESSVDVGQHLPPPPDVAPGEPIGILKIPRLDVDVVIAEGTGSSTLRRAVGRWQSGPWLGSDGNVIVAGHRDTFFRPLESIREGDTISIETAGRKFDYRVTWSLVVDPEDLWVTSSDGEPSLTLVTCYPFRYVGAAPERFVVRAVRVDRDKEQSADVASRVARPAPDPERAAQPAASLPERGG